MATPSGCPEPPQVPESGKYSLTAQMLRAAGVRACSTDSDTFIFQASGGGWGINAGVNINNQKTTTLGCENVVAIAQQYKNTVQNINCILNKNLTNANTGTITVQSIVIQVENNSEIRIECGGGKFGIGQNMVVKDVTELSLTNSDQTEIKNQVESLSRSLIEVIQNNTSGLGSSEKGNKYVSEITNELNNINYNGKVTETINNINVLRDSSQNLVFLARNNSKIWISAGECEINQDMTVDIMSKLIVGNMIGNAFSNASKIINEYEEVLKQESKGTGIDAVAKNFWDNFTIGQIVVYLVIAVIILGGGFLLVKLLTNPNTSQNIKAIKSKN